MVLYRSVLWGTPLGTAGFFTVDTYAPTDWVCRVAGSIPPAALGLLIALVTHPGIDREEFMNDLVDSIIPSPMRVLAGLEVAVIGVGASVLLASFAPHTFIAFVAAFAAAYAYYRALGTELACPKEAWHWFERRPRTLTRITACIKPDRSRPIQDPLNRE